MAKTEEASDKGARITVLYNQQDKARIDREVARRESEQGYPCNVSDVLRDLVRGLPA